MDELSEIDDHQKQEEYLEKHRAQENRGQKGSLGDNKSTVVHLNPELEKEFREMCEKDKKE